MPASFCASPALRRPPQTCVSRAVSPRMSAGDIALRRNAAPALRALAAAGEWSALAGAIRGMWARGKKSEAARPDERLVAMAASLAADAGQFSVTHELFKEMRAHDVAPGPFSYSVMLKALGRARDVQGVLSTVREIDTLPILIDTVLLNSATDALVRVGRLHDAEMFVSRHAVQRNARTFNILIKGHVARSKVDAAFRVADDMAAAGFAPNDVTRNTLIAGCVRCGDYTRAWELADEISPPDTLNGVDVGETDQLNQLSVALTSVLVAHAEAGRIGDARVLLADMASRGAPATSVTYAALIKGCLRHGETEATAAAEEIFANAPAEARRDIAVHNAYVSGLCRIGRVGALHRALGATYEMYKRGELPSPNEETYNALIDGCVRCMDISRAESVARIMQRNGVPSSVVTFTILIRGYGEQGQAVRARDAFARMVKMGISPDRVSLNALIAACARGGDIDFATKVLSGMEQEGGRRSATCASYAPLISAAVRRRDLDGAWRTYTRMKKAGVKPNAYVCELLANAALKLGRDVVWGNRAEIRTVLAKRCCEVLKDGSDAGTELRTLRRWRRQMLTMFGRRKQLLRELENAKLEKDITSVSENIFKSHGWNEIESGFNVL